MCSRLNHPDVTVKTPHPLYPFGPARPSKLDFLHQRCICGEVGIDFVYDISLQEHAISNTTLMIDAGI